MKYLYSTILLLSMLTGIANAQEDYNLTISDIGVQGDYYYISTIPAPSLNCANNVIYSTIDPSNIDPTYSHLLKAKQSDQPLNRVQYTKDNNNYCYLELVEVDEYDQ